MEGQGTAHDVGFEPNSHSFSQEGVLWSRALVGEMVPGPVSPLGYSAVWEPALIPGFEDLLVRRLGFDPSELGPNPPIAARRGLLYLNASVMRVLGHRLPSFAADSMEQLLQVGDVPLPAYEPESWHRPDAVVSAQLQQWCRWVFEGQGQSELEADEREADSVRLNRPDLGELDDNELVARAFSFQPLCRRLFNQHMNQTLAAFMGPSIIHRLCTKVGQPSHSLRLMSGLGNVESVGPTYALWDLSRLVRSSTILSQIFDRGGDRARRVMELSHNEGSTAMLAGLDAFMAEVGFRGPNEWDLASPTWDVAPDIVVALVDCLRRVGDGDSPRRRRRHLEADRLRLAEEITSILDGREGKVFVEALTATATFLRGRERSRTSLIEVIHEIRVPIRELADRAVRRGELSRADRIWMLTADELEYYADGGLADCRSITDKRHARLRRFDQPVEPVYVDQGGEWEPLGGFSTGPTTVEGSPNGGGVDMADRARLLIGDVMIGVPGSPGLAQGRARVIGSDTDLALVEPGEVLILADPDLVAAPLFVTAAAVVLDRGRTFSHAAVVAREFGIPVVVGALDASRRIATGDLVNVDGLTGVVSVADDAHAAVG